MSDTDSIDSVISTLYAVISGPAGEKRDWQRNNALFFPGARVVRTLKGEDGIPVAKAMTTEEYAQSTQKYFDENAFFETEIARRTSCPGESQLRRPRPVTPTCLHVRVDQVQRLFGRRPAGEGVPEILTGLPRVHPFLDDLGE